MIQTNEVFRARLDSKDIGASLSKLVLKKN